MSIDFVQLLRQIPGYQSQIAHVEPLPAKEARLADPAQPLAPALAAALAERGVARLYAHQAAALDAARAGGHIGVVTATASGKTLCYQLPAVESILADQQSRALLLFPTKALSHDQMRSLGELLGGLARHGAQPIYAATLDGDTPYRERDRLRAQAQIILSNPDMLHRTLLPDHQRWAALLANLRYIVIDEAHIYRGVFGTHVALVLRRLRRVCAHYGSAPQFICCSATSANPQEHLAALVGDPVRVIDGDGAPQGVRSFVFWNPPLAEDRSRQRSPGRRSAEESGRRRSTNVETASLLAHLSRSAVKTLAFARSRRGAELVLRYTREALAGRAGAYARPAADENPQVASYRAGYTPEQRRELELAFQNGELRGMVSTNALELGVDIGGVDAVVIGGFPGSVASTWQQAGRAGRSKGHALAVLVGQDDPLDQFYMRHPEQFFARSHEHARVALDNPFILRDQLRCAAAELPLHDADALWFGPTYPQMRDYLLRHGQLHALDDGRAVCAEKPAAEVNIRSADGDPVALKDSETGRTIEQISATRAPFEVYPGAIYLHQGDSYLVSGLDERAALAKKTEADYFTQTIEETEIAVERVREQLQLGPSTLCLGVVQVTRRVTGYRRKRLYSDEVISEHDLNLPPLSFRTVAVWWTVPRELVRRLDGECEEPLDALHAMEHACIGMLPLLAQCDRADIGGLSTDDHPDTKQATIFVYDGVPGGVGIAQVGYEQAEEWWRQTRALLVECPCADGCPACIQSPKCGNGNQHLSKPGAAALASLLLDVPVPARRGLGEPASATPATPGGARALVFELRDRLAKARATPKGPRQAALLVALRYRISTERTGALDLASRAALDQIEAEIAKLSS